MGKYFKKRKGADKVRIYHICELCDQVFYITYLEGEDEKRAELCGICPECNGEIAWHNNALIFKGYDH